jgi:hypothetical protein
MTPDPAVVDATTGIPQAAELMTAGQFRHLLVVGESGLVGVVDIAAISAPTWDGAPPKSARALSLYGRDPGTPGGHTHHGRDAQVANGQ